MKNKLIELRKEAEQSVADMKDGPLKVKAFETILGHLLSETNGAVARQSPRSATPLRKAQPATQNSPESVADRILSLKDEGFFKSPRSIAEIRQELQRNGWHYAVTSLSGPLQSLVKKRALRRDDVQSETGRSGWKYFNP
jgi:hypothetical protein